MRSMAAKAQARTTGMSIDELGGAICNDPLHGLQGPLRDVVALAVADATKMLASKCTQPAGGKTTENVAEQAADEEDLTKAPAVPIVAEPQLVLGENSGKAKVGKDGKDRTAPYG